MKHAATGMDKMDRRSHICKILMNDDSKQKFLLMRISFNRRSIVGGISLVRCRGHAEFRANEEPEEILLELRANGPIVSTTYTVMLLQVFFKRTMRKLINIYLHSFFSRFLSSHVSLFLAPHFFSPKHANKNIRSFLFPFFEHMKSCDF